MTFKQQLAKKRDAILRRWVDEALSTYSNDASAAFRRPKDPFANPVGHSLRVGTATVFDALLEGLPEKEIRGRLEGMVKIRAVQEFTASQALAFVFGLKRAARAELGGASGAPPFATELAKWDAEVDRLVLTAFDVFVECREQVSQLRINEVKRRVSWVLEKMGQRDPDAELVTLDPE